MWISRKLSSMLKQKSSTNNFIHSLHHKKKCDNNNYEDHISFVLAVISTVDKTGKSSLIQNFDIEEIIKDDDVFKNNISPAIGKLYRLKNNEQFIVQIIEYNEMPLTNLDLLDGAFICYDTTNRDSINHLPDMINIFVSQHVPCLLIGLKSDLTLERTVDTQLGHLIGSLFGIQAIESDTVTASGIRLLQKYFIQFIYSDRKMLLYRQQSNVKDNEQYHDHPITANLANKSDCTDSSNEKHRLKNMSTNVKITVNNDKQCVSSLSNSTATITSRTSSCGTAVTTATTNKLETTFNIIDEVIDNEQDENISLIFLTMYRKFMRPSELAKILIERFESDLLASSNREQVIGSETTEAPPALALPSSRQERIRSLFSFWLIHHWGDFKSSAIRRRILEFLERISVYEQLSHVHQTLSLLVLREPDLCDKDSYWGMCDEEDDKIEALMTATEQKSIRQQRKKDSGYCESFGDWIGHELNRQQQQQHHDERMVTTTPTTISEPITKIKKRPTMKLSTSKLLASSLRRAVSTNSHQKVPDSFNTNASSTQEKRHDLTRNSSPVISSNSDQNRYSGSPYCPAIFGGGLISVIEQEYILVDPLEIVNSISATKLAEQLTWIEAELFRMIQPRDFLRHLWNQRKKRRRSHNPENNPVLASIEHFNFVSGWIASLIVGQVDLEKRITVFEYCLKIALEVRNLNNFNTLMAILAGVNSAAVLRLKLTRESIKVRNKKLFQQFTELESLMSSERSFHNYRSALKQAELPGIPYLGIHQQDLVSLGEANKDHKTNGKVHWKKFRLMGESIVEMMRFQYPTHHLLEPNPYLLYFIGHESIPTEDERYEKSIEIEPKLLKPSVSTSSCSTSSRWLTALK
ncbi:unnamed protein product [Mucor hiemalis]